MTVSDKITEYQEPVSEAFNLVGAGKTEAKDEKKKKTTTGGSYSSLIFIVRIL